MSSVVVVKFPETEEKASYSMQAVLPSHLPQDTTGADVSRAVSEVLSLVDAGKNVESSPLNHYCLFLLHHQKFITDDEYASLVESRHAGKKVQFEDASMEEAPVPDDDDGEADPLVLDVLSILTPTSQDGAFRPKPAHQQIEEILRANRGELDIFLIHLGFCIQWLSVPIAEARKYPEARDNKWLLDELVQAVKGMPERPAAKVLLKRLEFTQRQGIKVSEEDTGAEDSEGEW